MVGPNISVTLQTLSITVDSLGSQVESYTNVKTISGVLTRSLGVKSFNEKQISNKQTVVADCVFFIDYDSSITISEKDRLVYGTRVFDIIWIYEPGSCGHHLELYLREIK